GTRSELDLRLEPCEARARTSGAGPSPRPSKGLGAVTPGPRPFPSSRPTRPLPTGQLSGCRAQKIRFTMSADTPAAPAAPMLSWRGGALARRLRRGGGSGEGRCLPPGPGAGRGERARSAPERSLHRRGTSETTSPLARADDAVGQRASKHGNLFVIQTHKHVDTANETC